MVAVFLFGRIAVVLELWLTNENSKTKNYLISFLKNIYNLIVYKKQKIESLLVVADLSRGLFSISESIPCRPKESPFSTILRPSLTQNFFHYLTGAFGAKMY